MKNVKPGDKVRFTAQQVNAWNKAAEAHRAGKFQSLETAFSESSTTVIITIQNKTDEFAGIFSVLALGESINLVGTDIDKATPDAFNKDVRFEGNKPLGDGTETVCITLGVAEEENITQAVILGAVGCVVDVTDVNHRYAAPITGDTTKLQSVTEGIIKILNPLTETGEQFCYVLLGGGGVAGAAPPPSRARLVQRKELFPACEYKSLQDVHDATFEYSDDGNSWIPVGQFDIVGGRIQKSNFNLPEEPHKYWRINLKGFSKPENPENDRGFYTFGRLWEALFWVKREVETKKTVHWIDANEQEQSQEYTFTATVSENWLVNQKEPLAVELSLSSSVPNSEFLYRTGSDEWKTFTGSIPAEDIQTAASFQFKVESDGQEFGNLMLRRPAYTLSPNDAKVAMSPSNEDEDVNHLFFDSKPTPRKAQNHRYWMLTFNEPEIVTKVMLDVDQHIEHYIMCPGGRDANNGVISLVYSFDLAAEKWTATTFPEMQEPVFNMDAKVVELSDKTHQLVILSGQNRKGFCNFIQGYHFERDKITNATEAGVNFAGRPALTGDPMLRARYAGSYPDGESDYSKSLLVVGGSERSCFIRGSTSTIDSVLFFVQGSTLMLGAPYETQTLNLSFSNTGNTGLPFGFFDYKSYASQAGAVGARLQQMATYTRHQNLPVRGILRRRPKGHTSFPSASNPAVDFLLIGGFCQVGREEYNKRVVSGLFNSPTASQANANQYSLLIADRHFYNVGNEQSFLYYPDSPYTLGDCCAEYVAERDEVICFGGRSNESDTALAHDTPAVLEFGTNNSATWITGQSSYSKQPNPRWSAASVLIKGLQRNGEKESCDRIFIIGGRNKDGFVADVDVFNLKYNRWETDWKGLDQGELESIPASMGGSGTTIIIQGGSGNSGVQSVKAGYGIEVTGDSKNPTVGWRGVYG